MSTYYYAVCDDHKIVSDVIGGRSFPDRWWQNDEGELAEFLEEHASCNSLRILSEHDDETTDYTEIPAAKERHARR